MRIFSLDLELQTKKDNLLLTQIGSVFAKTVMGGPVLSEVLFVHIWNEEFSMRNSAYSRNLFR